MKHAFQPVDIDFAEFNPFLKIGKDWFLITAGDEEKVNTMTAGWGSAGVMWGKNCAFIVVRESRYTKEFLDKCDTFSIGFFEKNQHSALKYLGQVSGRDEDKIANARMSVEFYNGTPYIDESYIVCICKKLSATKLTPDQFVDADIEKDWYAKGDFHTMYIGEITCLMAR